MRLLICIIFDYAGSSLLQVCFCLGVVSGDYCLAAACGLLIVVTSLVSEHGL